MEEEEEERGQAAHLNIELPQFSLEYHWVCCEGHWADICGKKETQVGFTGHRKTKGKSIPHFKSGTKPPVGNPHSAISPVPTPERKGCWEKQIEQETAPPFWNTQQAANPRTSRKLARCSPESPSLWGKLQIHTLAMGGDVGQGSAPPRLMELQDRTRASWLSDMSLVTKD